MRVYEAAREFKVEPDKMLTILRGMGARVTSEASTVDDATVAKLRARLERERRAGHTDLEESLEHVVEDAQPAGKRRRRRKEDIVEVETTADAAADAAEAIAAEAAEEAAARGEDLAETAVAEATEMVEAAAAPSEPFFPVEPARPQEPETPLFEERQPPAEEIFRPAAVARPPQQPTAEQRPKLRRAAEV